MDTIRELGVNPNAPSSESLPILTSLSIPQLLSIRDDLFTENANQGLTCDGDVLVSRKDSRKKPLNSKLAEDIICLLFCIKNESVVPRTMLKNGKRRKDYLDASRRENLTLSQVPTPTQRHRSHDSDSATSGSTANVTSTLSESVRASVLMKDINLLKKDLDDLKRNVSLLFRQKPSPPVPSTCHICIIFPHRNPSLESITLESDNISELIGCPALSVVRINIKTLKVKIYKECLHKALLSSNSNSHLVKIWRSKSSGPPPTLHSHSTQSRVDRPSTISIASWNCRGLHNAIPYIRTILSDGIDIFVLQEHWLWPFQVDQLRSISDQYSYTAVCDRRLNSTCELHRGCGGVAILWRKSLNAVPQHHHSSDRICSLQISISESLTLTVIGIYMPSADQPQEAYSSYLDEVNDTVAKLSPNSPAIIVGDFNCHLGHLGGPRSSDTPNSRGLQWKELIDHHSLHVPSLCHFAQGPVHTYHCSSVSTTVDYVLGNLPLSTGLLACETLEDHPLNTSDHLPIVTKLDFKPLLSSTKVSNCCPPLDWTRSLSDGSADTYAALSDDMVRPLMDRDYSSIEELEKDISHVCDTLLAISVSTIPSTKPRKMNARPRISDTFLSTLCWHSRVAFRNWKAAGCPKSGPEYEMRKKCKRDVSSHLSKCRAWLERRTIQKRDETFASHHPKRFKSHSSKTQGSNLTINGKLVTEPTSVLNKWVQHFTNLGQSLCSSNPSLSNIQSQIHQLEAQTYLENDYVLDSTIVVEEIEAALAHRKKSSSGGPDHLSPHHLSLSGPLFKNWICKIFNTILTLEAIPASFKAGIIIPLYKGKGKDPLSTDSYRGITLTSVLAKSFEFVLLDRILPTISDLNIPHLTQTAYQKGVSCSEAIFACQEAIAKLTREGDRVYSCFYDLASAFDSVEYPVLLSHLKSAGVTGKAWRLIKQWYTNPTSSVRVCGSVSSQFHIQRGVRQGSVLSPVLFLLVMDPILLELQSRSNGLNINGLFLGALSHADDIRTLSTNLTDCRAQISSVSSFATQRGLMLSTEKCEAIISPSVPANKSYIQADAIKIPISHSARCLGAWWTPNLSSSKWITVNINKARGALFSRGSGTFHGTLNPLSSRSIIECCVLPTLLYGAESWILNTTLLIKLESFQAEIGKKSFDYPSLLQTTQFAWPSSGPLLEPAFCV